MKIYYNPNCSKCQASLEILNDNKLKPDVINYLDTPPTKEELSEILNLLGMKAIELVRKGEVEFKTTGLDKANLSNDEVIEIMINNPILIERPILIHEDRAIIGRPVEKVVDFI